MKILRNVNKGITKSISILTKIIGVNCSVFFPLETQDIKMHYLKDNDVKYESLPGYEGKLLIPKVVGNKTNSIDIIDDYELDEIVLYTTSDLLLPKYSQIITNRPDGSIENFIINEIKSIKDDERVFFYKYFLVPDVGIDVEHNREALTELLEEAYDDTGIPKVDESMPLTKTTMDSSEIKYDPIG